ncbi:MAG: HD domain-containing protein [Deltaproteobacteria bacterium]|nr:HD domain-containing protein [Deltaproteobacteria bacterium]
MRQRLLSRSKVLTAVGELSQQTQKRIYLVGGVIRDFLLERPIGKDFDFTAEGDVGPLAREFARKEGGQAFLLNDFFGTWRVVGKRGKKKTEVDFSPLQGSDIFSDLRKRDFTVNSLAIPVNEISGSLFPGFIDPLNGLSDLRRKILRANSAEAMQQDPVRMLRAFRLSCTLGLTIENKTLQMIRDNRTLLLRCSQERIRQEFFTALQEPQAEAFLRNLHQAGLLAEIFPEIKSWEDLDQGADHVFPLLEHAFRTVRAEEFLLTHLAGIFPNQAKNIETHFSQAIEDGLSRKALLKFVALFHDSGKPATRTFSTAAPFVRFLDHDQEGQRINTEVARRLKLGRRAVNIISLLTRQHMRILSLSRVEELSPRAKYRFSKDLGREEVDAIFLALADGLAMKAVCFSKTLLGQFPPYVVKLKEIAEELLKYYFEEFTVKKEKPLLSGEDIIAAFQIPQGKDVGRILAKLHEAEREGIVHSREEALEYLKNIDKFRNFS